MEAGCADNKNAFYKEAVQYECRWRKNKMPSKGECAERLHVRKYRFIIAKSVHKLPLKISAQIAFANSSESLFEPVNLRTRT